MNQHDATADTPDADVLQAAASAEPLGKVCANCGALMHGPYCYACGQPEKGMIRHLASVLSDVADTVFNIDSRVFRSLGPLYLRPGFLTEEYFAGRRTRYVTPFRLFFFLCVIAFFAMQATLNLDDVHFDLGDSGDSVNQAQTVTELQKRTQHALQDIQAAHDAPAMPSAAKKELENAQEKIRKQSAERLDYLQARDAAKARAEAPPVDPHGNFDSLSFDNVPWDPVAHPLHIAWLPAFANSKLNEVVGHARENLIAARRDPRRLIANVFSVLPQTLFVLMPLFAVLLKIVYFFKHRLYMEHLMVALHSHAFIFMSLLLLAITHLLTQWAGGSVPAAVAPLNFLRDVMWIWLPIYLFLMAKRVYKQGWLMTTLSYGIVGICYATMLGLGLGAAIVIGIATG